MPGSLRSLVFAVNLSAFALALAAACDGGGELDDPAGSSGAAGSSNAGQGGTSSGSGGGAQQGAGGSGTAGNAGSGANGGGASSGASGGGGDAGNSAGGAAGGAAGVAGNGGGSAGVAGSGGSSAGAGAGGAGLCPPAKIEPAPKCGQTPPPELQACADCLCANNACRTAYEACTAMPGCSRIAS
ncbi:MAG TPA: hypothetical protein VFS00_03210, partial [Polyangiaceae bacterium]|nr:hypothetical protein [Polyangiaceae bacterium]